MAHIHQVQPWQKCTLRPTAEPGLLPALRRDMVRPSRPPRPHRLRRIQHRLRLCLMAGCTLGPESLTALVIQWALRAVDAGYGASPCACFTDLAKRLTPLYSGRAPLLRAHHTAADAAASAANSMTCGVARARDCPLHCHAAVSGHTLIVV